MKQKWDKKAHRYGRYSPTPDTLERAVFDLLEDMGVSFENKSIIDIGCGTGVYTLHIAQKAAHVDAVDISQEMLNILKEDAASCHITNIDTYQSDWEDFMLPAHKYDIALSTMSPATREEKGFAKMDRSANTRIFLGWGDKRDTDLIEELFISHGQTYTPPNGAVKLRKWLDKNKIEYSIREHIELKTRVKPIKSAIDKYTWHLEARGMAPDRQLIETTLLRYLDSDGNVVESVKNYFNLIVW